MTKCSEQGNRAKALEPAKMLVILSACCMFHFMMLAIGSGIGSLKKWQPNLTDLASNSIGLSIFSLILIELSEFLSHLSTKLTWLNSSGYILSLPLFGTALGSALLSWTSWLDLCWNLTINREAKGPYRKSGRVWQIIVAIFFWIPGLNLLKQAIIN